MDKNDSKRKISSDIFIICTLVNWKALNTNLALKFKDFISKIENENIYASQFEGTEYKSYFSF